MARLSDIIRERDTDFVTLNLLEADQNLSDVANSDISLVNLGVTATTAELNTLDGLTANTTELNYVDGVTSPLQTQLNTKVETLSDLGVIASSTELNYVDGTTSNIQTQLDGKPSITYNYFTSQF